MAKRRPQVDWAAKARRTVDRMRIPANRRMAHEYLDFLQGSRRKPSTLMMPAKVLRRVDASLGKPFATMDAKDLMKFFGSVQISNTTVQSWRVLVKAFWRQMLPKRAERVTGWIRIDKVKSPVTADDVLTQEEVLAMAKAAKTPRDAAMVMVLWDSGMRVSEFLSLRIRDVKWHEQGWAELVLPEDATDLKTGRRIVPLVLSAPFLGTWFQNHPAVSDPMAPLWPVLNGGYKGEFLSYQGFIRQVQYAALKAGIHKRVYPHLFRHSRATEAARKSWSEALQRKFFGWTPGSVMPSRYVHLVDSDLTQQVLHDAGVKQKPKPDEGPIAIVQCPHCKWNNQKEAVFCQACGRPLSTEAIAKWRGDDINMAEFLKTDLGRSVVEKWEEIMDKWAEDRLKLRRRERNRMPRKGRKLPKRPN